MIFSISLLFVFLTFVLSEKCSETLYGTFKKGFNVTDMCDGCVVLNHEVSYHGGTWGGFCVRDQLFLFKNWKCRKDKGFLIESDSLAIITTESCKLNEKNYDLNEECMRKFRAQKCNAFILEEKQNREKRFDKKLNSASAPVSVSSAKNVEVKNNFKTLNNKPSDSPTLFGRRSTALIKSSTTKTTSFTESTSTEGPSEAETSKTTPTKDTSVETNATEDIFTEMSKSLSVSTTVSKTDPNNGFSSTTKSSAEDKNHCEPNEFFFKDHCYFIQVYRKNFYDLNKNMKTYEQNVNTEAISLDIINLTRSCQYRHSRALGLAVETEEENKAVLKFFKTISYNKCTIFSSGVRVKEENEWRGWNLKINLSALNFKDDIQPENAFYCINTCRSYWYLLSPAAVNLIDFNFYVICERPHNPKNILPELHQQCLQLYRKSTCYNLEKHSKYCCEKDENGELWFACPNETHRKIYSDHLQCSWTCNQTGFFFQDRPTCQGNFICNDSYNGIRYVAPATKYAKSDCPEHHSGHSTWYCSRNRTFIGKPDFSLCCKNTMLSCRDSDVLLNAWMGCPSKTVLKKTSCPPNTFLKEVFAEWYCQENGTFSGTAPDYSKCNKTSMKCKKQDRYGILWEAGVGTTCKKACPSSFTGNCFWKCKKSGVFDGPQPDCSKCMASWMMDIDNKIKTHSNYEEIMEIMESYTKKEDLRIGYSHVLDLTSGCIVLFKNQTSQSEISIFEKFLMSYSKILKNIAGDPNVWSSFSETNRREFSDEILKITHDAAFAKLEYESMSSQKYNATLAESREDGFDFFVAYNFSIGSQFPLRKSSKRDWHLDVIDIKESSTSFAAMGLVMNCTLSSLMFPQRKAMEDLRFNAPVVTFKVATHKNGAIVFQPNVIVSISFKHANKTRLPATRVINRRLHQGEEPSGVFNSTLCYYYRDSVWTTEGCFVTFTSKERTNCTCQHLSTIGLLMSVHKYQPNKTLEIVSTINSVITIISLILALLVFYFFDTFKNDRVLISQNLCFCLLIGHIMLITVMDKKFFNIPDNYCKVYAVVLHYVFLAAFAWMLVEGCHLYRMLVLVFDSDVDYRWIYLLFGYGAPFVVVGVTQLAGYIFKDQPYGQDELCWLKPPIYVWAFTGPVLVTTLINFCILITAMKLAISSKRRTEKSNFGTLKLWIKGWISLSTLLGITWLFGFFYIHQNEMFAYVFVVFNGLQGFFIFLFRCVLSEYYQTIFLKKIKHRFFNSNLKNHMKSENIKSETKLYAISATKSLSGDTETKDSGYDPGLNGLEGKKSSKLNSRSGIETREKSSGVDVNINVILKPEISEAYLRNKMIARNFSLRKSKRKWMVNSDDFLELSYQNIY